ncbi:polyprenyl glycosylphosphotransferase [Tepiditoga spiralis]|uniref:Polyprenyl glycosylphosphotransferase n=1 Tax=Tepiditoga spiralis TaxID=2108365 RepID=A0A7G1GA15_9BACT|nr:sugar transferase [Tepiditoga spiralis]BBE30209.1 polyprenyl glycosylphosphotransferase [Tepiditoga spiralis]
MRKAIKLLDMLIILLFNIYAMALPIWLSLIITAALFIGLYAFRTYDSENMKSINENLIRTTVGTIIGYIIILLVYVFIEKYINRYIFLYNLLFVMITIPVLHKIEYILYSKHFPVKRYLVIGRKNEIGKILDEITKKSMNKLQFVEYINPSPVRLEKLMTENYEEKNPLYFFNLKKEKETAKNNFNAIIITDPKLEDLVKPQLQEYKKRNIPIEYLPNIAENYLKRIPLEVAEKFKEYYEVIFQNVKESPAKRIGDIIISSVLFAVFSPFMLIISFFTLFEDGKPIVFSQKRVGKNEQLFKMHKFRSLKNQPINKENPNAGIEQRVLKIGKITRKLRIDETLQFFNVLIGNMSIVGSRPEMQEFHNQMKGKILFYPKRLLLNPGITGWAQINYKHTTTLEDYKKKTEYDLYYIKNRTSIMDLQIMLKTAETMLGMRGSR